MLVVVIGGAGWLWGGVLGAIAFKLMHDLLSGVDAAVLDLLARPVPGRARDGRPGPPARAVDLGAPAVSVVLETRKLVKHFGGFTATHEVSLRVEAARATR